MSLAWLTWLVWLFSLVLVGLFGCLLVYVDVGLYFFASQCGFYVSVLSLFVCWGYSSG